MKRTGILLFFFSLAILLTVVIAQTTGLSLKAAGVISAVACILVYLMLDLRPDQNPGDGTVIRLTKGSWHKKKK